MRDDVVQININIVALFCEVCTFLPGKNVFIRTFKQVTENLAVENKKDLKEGKTQFTCRRKRSRKKLRKHYADCSLYILTYFMLIQ